MAKSHLLPRLSFMGSQVLLLNIFALCLVNLVFRTGKKEPLNNSSSLVQARTYAVLTKAESVEIHTRSLFRHHAMERHK